MEFFAAVCLVGNKEAWTELFEEIDGKCVKSETRPVLQDVVRELGLENVTKVVVGYHQMVHNSYTVCL